MKITKTFGLILIIFVTFLVGLFSGRTSSSSILVDATEKTVVDTVAKPIPPPSVVSPERVDTVFYTVHDTTVVDLIRYVVRVDTLEKKVYIPIERKEYRTQDYYAVIEGYKPELISIETYNKTTNIDRVTTVKLKPRWGVGLQVGYGTDFKRLTPYVGVGIQYNLFTW